MLESPRVTANQSSDIVVTKEPVLASPLPKPAFTLLSESSLLWLLVTSTAQKCRLKIRWCLPTLCPSNREGREEGGRGERRLMQPFPNFRICVRCSLSFFITIHMAHVSQFPQAKRICSHLNLTPTA